MPFRSQSQRRLCYSKHDPDWNCELWDKHTPKKKLPERVKSFKEFVLEKERLKHGEDEV